MRVVTQAIITNKPDAQQSAAEGAPPKEVQGSKSKAAEVSKGKVGGSSKQPSTLLQLIASVINQILGKDRVKKPVKITLERLLKFVRAEEKKEKKKVEISAMQLEVSTFHKELKQDLMKMQEVLATQIENV